MTVTSATLPVRSPALSTLFPVLIGAAVFLTLIAGGRALLNDADTYWHIAVGQWMMESGTVPHVDPFSSTALGEPWIAKEWLSQLLYAFAHDLGGWTAVIVLTAVAAAAAFGLLGWFLRRNLTVLPAVLLVSCAFVLVAPHLVARPHVLALPVMVGWVGGLAVAADRRQGPSLWLLPLMVLWANLHGGFTLGLLLSGAFGLDAVVSAPREGRIREALRWAVFLVAAVLCACVTPYGAQSIGVTLQILGLGPALSIIGEWRPQDFGSLSAFEVCLLLAIGLALLSGLRIPPIRLLIVLGLLHLALSATRNGELLGLLAPLTIAAPIARQFPYLMRENRPRAHGILPWTALPLVLLVIVGWWFVRSQAWSPSPARTPAAAVAALENAGVEVLLNDYDFGGYLIYEGIAPFIDGRTELYGGNFVMRHHRAVTLADLTDLRRLLDEYEIDATLLAPATPAVAFFDLDPGWQRLYADGTAVVHIRR